MSSLCNLHQEWGFFFMFEPLKFLQSPPRAWDANPPPQNPDKNKVDKHCLICQTYDTTQSCFSKFEMEVSLPDSILKRTVDIGMLSQTEMQTHQHKHKSPTEEGWCTELSAHCCFVARYFHLSGC